MTSAGYFTVRIYYIHCTILSPFFVNIKDIILVDFVLQYQLISIAILLMIQKVLKCVILVL